jgi:signal transduction histidine kinase/CheY-like chemotaxis protein
MKKPNKGYIQPDPHPISSMFGLRARFFIHMILLIVVLMGGVFFVVELNNRKVILAEGRKRGFSNALYLAALSKAPLLMYDYTKLEQNVDAVAKEENVAYAIILDRNGNVMAHSHRNDLIGQALEDPVSLRAASSTTQLIQDVIDPSTGDEIWDIAQPIYQDHNQRWGTVRIGFSKRQLKAEISANRRNLFILSLIAVMLAAGAATILSERITDPVLKLTESAMAIAMGDLKNEITIRTGDEIEKLSNTFNYMRMELLKHRNRQKKLINQLSRKNKQLQEEILLREQLEGELIKTERLRALGEMSGGVAHDFNNILGAILGRAQLLLEKVEDPYLVKGIQVIEKAALDGSETVRRIQEFTRVHADNTSFVEMDVNQVLEDALEFTRSKWKNEADAKGISIVLQCNFARLPPIIGDPAGLREVFTNLIINAVDAMPRGGILRISTMLEDEFVIVEIADTGIGMSPEVQKRIFDPFFTTKGTRGSGLGLSICYGIISRHMGEIRVKSQVGSGSTFSLILPINLSRKRVESKTRLIPELIAARVLVIDDDDVFRSVVADSLLQSGCRVDEAGSGNEGLELFSSGDYDIVLTDLGMEDMSGWEVAEKIKERSPKTPVALMSGWSAKFSKKRLRERGIDFIITKPFKIDELRNLVHKAVSMNRSKLRGPNRL